MSVPPGGPLAGMDRPEAIKRFHEGLERVLPRAESAGVTILIEPEPGLLLENSAQFKSFVTDVRSPAIGLNFDIGHFFCVGEDPAAAFEDLFRWVKHVHLEDIAADRVHRHLIPGHGAIAFDRVLDTLVRMEYPGDVCVELYPYTETPDDAGRESLDYLMPLFEDANLPIRRPSAP